MRACVCVEAPGSPAIGVWMKLRKCICLYVALEGKTEHFFCTSLDSNAVHLVSRIFHLFGVVRVPGLQGGIFWALTHLWRWLLNRSLGKNIWNPRERFFFGSLSHPLGDLKHQSGQNLTSLKTCDVWVLLLLFFFLEETWQRNIFIVQVSTLQRKFSLCNLTKSSVEVSSLKCVGLTSIRGCLANRIELHLLRCVFVRSFVSVVVQHLGENAPDLESM